MPRKRTYYKFQKRITMADEEILGKHLGPMDTAVAAAWAANVREQHAILEAVLAGVLKITSVDNPEPYPEIAFNPRSEWDEQYRDYYEVSV